MSSERVMRLDLDTDIPEPSLRSRLGAVRHMELVEKTRAISKAADLLTEYGLKVPEPSSASMQVAAAIAIANAENPEKTNAQLTPERISATGAAAMLLTGAIVESFGRTVVHDAVRVRNLVTNKLILETENKDARIRLRALEMLGKFADVGLFMDRKEVTVTHQSTDELKQSLRAKLSALKDVTPVEDATILEDD